VADDAIVLEVGDRQVRLSSPDKVLFPESGWRKRDSIRSPAPNGTRCGAWR
jgi:hypothetical protein